MPFVKFELPKKPEREPKPSPDVKIGSLGFSIKKSALQPFGLSDATHVDLWYDAETNSVGISKSEATNKSSFRLTPRGKTGDNLFIGTKRFIAAFSIEFIEKNATADLRNEGGIAAFTLPGGKPAATPKPYTGAPRGRKKKNAEA